MGPTPCFLSSSNPAHCNWEPSLDPWDIWLSRNHYYAAKLTVAVVSVATVAIEE